MLVELTIRELAIVDYLCIRWAPGLNVLTGETGAGKSIILEAVAALLGDRLGPEHLRAGASRGLVEGVFQLDLADPLRSELREALDAEGLLEDEQTVVLSREVAGSRGRSVARVNGRAIPLSTLQRVGGLLLDIHGQSEHLSLLRPREHLRYLDHFGGLLPLRASVADLVSRMKAIEGELLSLSERRFNAERERQFLLHELAEIEAADPQPGEEEELLVIRQRLRNGERLRETIAHARQALGGSGGQNGGRDLVALAARALQEAAELDAEFKPLVEELDHALAVVEGAHERLGRVLSEIVDDPRQLAEVEERWLVLADLKRKFGGSLAEALRYAESARSQLQSLEQAAERTEELSEQLEAVKMLLGRLAATLSHERRRTGQALAAAVESELQELGMPDASLLVNVQQAADPGGIAVQLGQDGPQHVRCDAWGIDGVEFLFSANAGEAPLPLARIASGGELARVSLALKAVLSAADPRPTLIFDEIDAGVGGRSAAGVGQRLWRLTRDHQVLCVTHLPQVASFGDLHLVVTKETRDGRSITSVEATEGEPRLRELAAMLSGRPNSAAAQASARELLHTAHSAKGSSA